MASFSTTFASFTSSFSTASSTSVSPSSSPTLSLFFSHRPSSSPLSTSPLFYSPSPAHTSPAASTPFPPISYHSSFSFYLLSLLQLLLFFFPLTLLLCLFLLLVLLLLYHFLLLLLLFVSFFLFLLLLLLLHRCDSVAPAVTMPMGHLWVPPVEGVFYSTSHGLWMLLCQQDCEGLLWIKTQKKVFVSFFRALSGSCRVRDWSCNRRLFAGATLGLCSSLFPFGGSTMLERCEE